jgi:hypothetical protein
VKLTLLGPMPSAFSTLNCNFNSFQYCKI